MKEYFRYFITLAILGVLLNACGNSKQRVPATKSSSSKPVPQESATNMESDCVDFVVMLSTAEVAAELGQSESYVQANYKINVWANPSSSGNRGSVVGKIIPGSNCRLLEKRGNDYKIQSPFDKSIGWITSVQIKGVTKKNPKTFQPC
jgi:hypothetical protein